MANLLKRQIAGIIVNETEKAVCLRCEVNDQSGHKWSVQNMWFPKSSLTECAPYPMGGNLMANDSEYDINNMLYFDVADWFFKKQALSNQSWYPAYNIIDPNFLKKSQKN